MSWGNRHQGGISAPVAASPFAAAPAQVGGAPANRPGIPDPNATGPILGKGSELQKLYYMPHNMGHNGCVQCIAMADDGKIYTGGRDESLFVWKAQGTPQTGLSLVQDCPPIALGSGVTALLYEPNSRWLFCGLWSGEIRAFCKDPVKDERLQGHRRSVTCLCVHSSVLISGSNDGTVRLWTANPQTGGFQCHGQPLQSPTGAVSSIKVLGDALWVGSANGITCFDLNSLQPRGTINSVEQVTGLIECQGFMAATFRNGAVKIYDSSGGEIFSRPPMGEHTSNTAVELMTHPIANKPMLLCGQQYGYVTAYDLPEFKPRGSFVCKDGSDIKAILDVKSGGMFLTAGFHGDIVVWMWTTPGANQGGGFGAQPQQAAPSPFAPSPCGGGGGMMA
eukprot:TRINITY_DN54044_c0_g1_i1.p1 TRINITY_DN54044_c0_g1~~TRINITY_DN54044_c0_g1_i1.p1  ORF type:complete len:392 (+),score=51.01 TRINITY_DN54044_c0_g1_i1:80-1255(+)